MCPAEASCCSTPVHFRPGQEETTPLRRKEPAWHRTSSRGGDLAGHPPPPPGAPRDNCAGPAPAQGPAWETPAGGRQEARLGPARWVGRASRGFYAGSGARPRHASVPGRPEARRPQFAQRSEGQTDVAACLPGSIPERGAERREGARPPSPPSLPHLMFYAGRSRLCQPRTVSADPFLDTRCDCCQKDWNTPRPPAPSPVLPSLFLFRGGGGECCFLLSRGARGSLAERASLHVYECVRVPAVWTVQEGMGRIKTVTVFRAFPSIDPSCLISRSVPLYSPGNTQNVRLLPFFPLYSFPPPPLPRLQEQWRVIPSSQPRAVRNESAGRMSWASRRRRVALSPLARPGRSVIL